MTLDLLDRLAITEKVDPWPEELIRAIVPDIKVIYSDVDGTLLGPGGCLFVDSKHGLTTKPAQAVIKCHEHNIDVVLVSGRNRNQLHSDARILGFKNWICELGCQITYNMGEVAILNVGDFPIGKSTVWQTIKEGGAPALLLDKLKGKLEYHLPWSENREFTHIFRGFIDVDMVNALLYEHGFDQLKIIDNGRVRRRSELLDVSLTEIHAYHLLPRASDKASAVQKDRETRGIPKNLTAAIGDSATDLELASEVGVLFLVRNAVTESLGLLEKIGAYPNVFVTHEAMGLGWAEAIDFLVGEK